MKKELVFLGVSSFISFAIASQVQVNTVFALQNAMASAVAGDTIWVASGDYVAGDGSSSDPGNLPNGVGLFWVGNDGTAEHPIVVAAKDPENPPVLQGETYSSGYVIHVTGNFVQLKSLKVTMAGKGVVFDNANDGLLEDCEVYNSGTELVHIRDGSSRVVLNRNYIHSSGNDDAGTYGEGFYIGTDEARWGADSVSEDYWGEEAVAEGYGGYDWHVDSTQVTCNWLAEISAEDMDIKEGTRFTTVKGNMLVADSIGLKSGANSYDDSFIDLKGVRATITGNYFLTTGTDISKYIAEVQRHGSNVPDSLTVEKSASPWCDDNLADFNICKESDNELVAEVTDPRKNCPERLPLYSSSTASLAPGDVQKSSGEEESSHFFDLMGRRR